MTQRQERLQNLLKQDVSEIFYRDFKDPRLGFVTVTDVEVSPDLSYAKVFVSVMGNEEERSRQFAILKKAEHFVRGALSKRLQLRVLPEIDFRLDTSIDHSIRILELLEEIKRNEEPGEPE